MATLIHELGHALVRRDRDDEDPELSYAAEELVVESVTYACTGAAGLDTSGFTMPYLASWAETAGIDTITRTAGLIDRLARRIDTALQPPEQPHEVRPVAA